MEQYILELLKDNQRLIIPGFGAFIVARDNELTIIFNSYLTFNDGTLVSHIAAKENISNDEAAEKIFRYVENIKTIISENDSYTISGLGTFSLTTGGNYQFDYKPEPAQKRVETERTEALKKDDDSDELFHIDTSVVITADESTEEVVNDNIQSSAIINDPLIELQTPQPTLEKKATKPQNQNKKMTQQNDKKRGWLWILAAILFAVAAGLIYLFYFAPQKEKTTVPVQEPGMIIDTTEVAPPVEDPEKQENIKKIDASKAFHIIVGSMKSEEAAQKMVQRLKAKGYNNATYFTRGQWYVVSIDALPNQIEAERVQEEILDRDRIESWIVNHR